jgi:His-Xaa-Ser system protein HxsD
MSSLQLSWVENLTDDTLSVCVNIDIYSTEALFRVCYLFTDRCYLFLSHDSGSPVIRVRFACKSADTNINEIVGDFSNELINQKVRLDVAAETKQIRELIVAQAFTEADLLDRNDSEASYLDDPKGISQ